MCYQKSPSDIPFIALYLTFIFFYINKSWYLIIYSFFLDLVYTARKINCNKKSAIRYAKIVYDKNAAENQNTRIVKEFQNA